MLVVVLLVTVEFWISVLNWYTEEEETNAEATTVSTVKKTNTNNRFCVVLTVTTSTGPNPPQGVFSTDTSYMMTRFHFTTPDFVVVVTLLLEPPVVIPTHLWLD